MPDEKISGYKTAMGTIRRKLELAGIPGDTSAIRMAEQAKRELLKLRREKAQMWELLKEYVRDRMDAEAER